MSEDLEKKADGIYLAGRFSEWLVGAWILESGGECAVMEMPPPTAGDINPALIVKKKLDEKGWKCRYLLFSHPHWDHTASIAEYRKAFPDAIFVAHYSAPLFLKMSEYYWTKGYLILRESPWDNVKEQCGNEWFLNNFNYIYQSDTLELSLAGEPLYLIYAPKHSLGDVHCLFKGVLFTGDWWLYEGDPCQDLAACSKAVESIERVEKFLTDKDYRAHSIFSAHGDNLFYDIDVAEALTRTRQYHLGVEEKMPDLRDWKNFGIDVLYRYFFPS
jgi:glyoxylase-like metal-dependent hydrolase (beta-lactamase superfamily II)